MASHVLSLLPPPATPPSCFRCSRPSTRCVTRHSNRNGNAGRPYFKCIPCNQFLVFADSRGNHPSNPPCPCGLSSKKQVSGLSRQVARAVHFVCRAGKCDFYQACGTDGETVVLEQETLDQFIRLRIV